MDRPRSVELPLASLGHACVNLQCPAEDSQRTGKRENQAPLSVVSALNEGQPADRSLATRDEVSHGTVNDRRIPWAIAGYIKGDGTTVYEVLIFPICYHSRSTHDAKRSVN